MHQIENIHIHTAKFEDIKALIDIWYRVSIEAEVRISKNYWKTYNDALLKYYLPNAEIYIAMYKDEIIGFVALIDHVMAALFVAPEHQGRGVGSRLISYIKFIRDHLTIYVYNKNAARMKFYKYHGFQVISTQSNNANTEDEYVFEWKNRVLMN